MKWYHWAIITLLLGGSGGFIYMKARGLRNNNPGNIELGANWQGRVPDSEQTDKRFVQFTSPKWGIRAMARIIDNYKKRGVVTVEQIIHTWAPPTENDSDSYVKSVLKTMGLPPQATGFVPVKEEGDYLALIKGIIKHENGLQPYSDETIKEGIALA